jgi:hypothetical protein
MPDISLLELHGQQSRAKHASLATVKFIGGLQTQRSPFASIDNRYNSRFLGGKPDALIAGSNCEVSNSLTLQRRYGLSNFGPAIPAPLAFFGWKQTTPPNTQVIVDTATAVYNYSPTAAGLLFFKSPGAGQTNFWGVNNTLYAGNGVDLYKVVGPNLLTYSNTFTDPSWVNTNPNTNLLSTGQFDPMGGLTATNVNFVFNASFPTVPVLDKTVKLNYTPIAANTFTFSVWARSISGATGLQLTIGNGSANVAVAVVAMSGTWTRYQVTGTMGAGDNTLIVALTQPSNGTATQAYSLYGAQLEVGGPATPTQITTDQPQGVYLWGIVAPTVAPTIASTVVASTWQATHAYNLGDTVTDSNGNLQQVSTAGTSGGTAPTWSQTFGDLTPDGSGSLVWIEAGQNSLSPTIGYNWYFSFLNGYTGHPSNVSPISPSSNTLADNTGVAYTITGFGSDDPQVNKIAIYRNTDGGPFFFQVGIVANPGAGSTWSFVDNVIDANLSSIYAPLGLLNSPPPAGAVNPIWHEGRMWVSVGSLLYYSSGPDNFALLNTVQNGVVAESFAALSNDPLDAPISRSFSTAAGLLVQTTSDVWLETGSNLSTFDPVKVLKGHGSLSYNASDMDGGTLWMYSSDRQLLSASSSAGTLEVGFPIGDTLQANVLPAKAYLARHVSGSLDNAVFLGDGTSGWFRCNPNQVGASVSGEQTVVWSPFAAITNGMGAMASVETTPGVHQLLVGANQGSSSAVQSLGNTAGSGANSGSGTVWSNPNNLTLNNPANPAFTDLNVQVSVSAADVSGGTTGSSDAPSTGSLGPTVVNDELALACFSGNTVQSGSYLPTTVTPGSGWSLDASGELSSENFGGGSFQHFSYGFEEQNLTATGSLTGNFSLSRSVGWAASLVTLSAGSGALPTVVQKAGLSGVNLLLGGTFLPLSNTLSVTKGNYLVVLASWANAVGGYPGSVVTVRDSLGDLYTSVTSSATTHSFTQIFIAPILATASNTITVEGDANVTGLAVEIYEVTLPAGAISGGAGPSSQFLQATNFGLNLPSGSVPIGIKVFVTGSQSSQNPDAEFTLSWINPSGPAPSFTFQLPTSGGTMAFGGTSFTWGQNLTTSLLNSSGFGFQLQANVVTSTNVTFSVSAVQVQVFYLSAAPVTMPVMFRDLTTFADVGAAFTWSATLGSLLLANEGTLAETETVSVTTRAANGAAPGVAVLLDEIAGSFESLLPNATEPPQLGASSSLLSYRYFLSQGTVPPICTHMQIQLIGGATNTRDEILRITVRGALVPEQE